MIDDKVYFTPGMKVRCKAVSNSPEMYVLRKKELTFKDVEDKNKVLQGIVCRWFTTDGTVQEALFCTKDLEKI